MGDGLRDHFSCEGHHTGTTNIFTGRSESNANLETSDLKVRLTDGDSGGGHSCSMGGV